MDTINNRNIKHYKRPGELPFKKEERDNVTILFGGLTLNHEYLLKGALESIGYHVQYLPVPDNRSMQIGKEYGNRGQCNPTYYTVGNLIRYLRELKTKGVESIEDKFVFLTAGACGPCRFGMYESEYRKSLKDAGFENFRVLTFEQSDKYSEDLNSGLQTDRTFYTLLIKALILGDMLNEIGYRIRPYEKNTGETNEVITSFREQLYNSFMNSSSIMECLKGLYIRLKKIEVDYLRVKPIVQITGEFWAQTTEGDGNYKLAQWLEAEGAEVKMEPISTWIDYLLWDSIQIEKDHITIQPLASAGRLISIFSLKRLIKFYFNSYRKALGWWIHELPSQRKLAHYAAPYFNVRITGGEGHLEIGKHIMAFADKKAHMVISVKPFGCMPSTLSDGVQSKVMSDMPDSLFLSIETSGDAEINVRSRVQMKLYEAKQRAKEEFNTALSDCGLGSDSLKKSISGRVEFTNPTIKVPHFYTGTAANFTRYIASQKKNDL